MDTTKSTLSSIAGITVLAVVVAATLGMDAPKKYDAMAPQVSYHSIKVDGLSIFYREAGPRPLGQARSLL
jgi:hypothetical protein